MGDGEGGGHGAGRKGVFSILALVTPSQVPLFLFAGSYSLDTDAAGLVSVSYLPIASFVFLFLLFLPLHFCLWQVSLRNSGWPATCCADWAVFKLVNLLSLRHLCAWPAPCSFSSLYFEIRWGVQQCNWLIRSTCMERNSAQLYGAEFVVDLQLFLK